VLAVQVAAQPAASTNLAGYVGPEQATAAKVRTVDPKSAGATGYLGVTVEPDKTGRPVVDTIAPKSPAELAGLKKGDLITRVGDRAVSTPQAFREWIQSYSPDEKVKLTVERDGKPTELTAELKATSRPRKFGDGPRPYLGLEVEEAKGSDGVKVKTVTADSPAAAAGIKVGDWLIKINGEELNRPTKIQEVLSGKRPRDELVFVVVREGKESELKATLTADSGRGRDGPPGKGGPGAPGRFGNRFQGGPPPLWTKPVMRVAVIGIEFPDTKHNAKATPEELTKHFLARNPSSEKVTGSGGLNDYLNEVSAGQFKLEGKVFPWVEVAKKRGEYVQGSGTSNRTAVLTEALSKLTARDGNDALKDFDALVFVYAGSRLATNRGAVYYPHAGTMQHQSRRVPYMLVPEGGSTLTALNGMVKEAGLLLGLPELAARSENIGSEGLGPWCAMSDPARTGKPQHYSAWCKEKLGWLKPTVIDPTVKQKLVLAPIEGSSRECFKVLVRPDGSEYLLLENRAKKGFDSDLPGAGLLVWRVVGDRPVLEESHGVEGPSGPTVHLSSVPYPSPANSAFTPNTIPSSRSATGGGLPVYLTDIRRHADGRVSFRIGYEFD
jgi:M6 family metalloprotease-like protein